MTPGYSGRRRHGLAGEAAACTCWPTSAAAASTARAGTRRRSKANRHQAYEDFAAVAEDLVARRITPPQHLGTQGGSNGGLLMGNMLTAVPGAVRRLVCQVPLLDMKRYHQLLAGASWMAEYGDPDKPDDWAFIAEYSPYQNVRARTRTIRRCCSPPPPATTACTRAMPAR